MKIRIFEYSSLMIINWLMPKDSRDRKLNCNIKQGWKNSRAWNLDYKEYFTVGIVGGFPVEIPIVLD